MPIRIIFILLAAALAAIQVYPPVERNNPPAGAEISAPAEVSRVLRRACYDCHSNETEWRWYSYVAPASWLLASDVQQARAHMNFSDYPHASRPDVDCHFKRRIVERIENGEMPPLRYRLLHADAAVSADELAIILGWTASQCFNVN